MLMFLRTSAYKGNVQFPLIFSCSGEHENRGGRGGGGKSGGAMFVTGTPAACTLTNTFYCALLALVRLNDATGRSS